MKNYQKIVDDWIKNYGVNYFDILTNMIILAEEVGELASVIARKYGQQSEKNKISSNKLGREISDILFVLICIANQTNINLEEEFKKNLSFKKKRDRERHKNNLKIK